jgi:hypothetical protein
LKFADGTTQTTAPTAAAGWTGPSTPWQARASVFAAWSTCAYNSPGFFSSPGSPGTRLVIELVSFKFDWADDVRLETTLNSGTVRHHIKNSVGYRVYADLSSTTSEPVRVGVCAPPCPIIDPITKLCTAGQGGTLDISLSGFIYGGATASGGWTGPSTPFQTSTSVFAPWQTCAFAPFGFTGGPTNNRAVIEFVSFKFNSFDKAEEVNLETTLNNAPIIHRMFNLSELQPVGYRVYADLGAPVPMRAGYCPGQCPGVDPTTGACPMGSAAGDNLDMTISGFIY